MPADLRRRSATVLRRTARVSAPRAIGRPAERTRPAVARGVGWRSRTVVVVRTEPARSSDATGTRGGTGTPDVVAAADSMTRFPFLVTDPEAATVRRPDAVVLTGLEPEVAAVAPGPELAALLTTLDPAEVTDRGLVELVDGAVRQAAWAYAAAARYAGLLGARDSMNPSWSLRAGVPKADDVTGDELALRLAWSRRAAARLVRHGRAFDRDLADTGAALARGELDAVRAGVVADRLHGLPIPVTLDVQDAVLPRAPRRTATQLVADVERALIAVDPAEAAARRRHARAPHPRRRCAHRPGRGGRPHPWTSSAPTV